MKKLAIIVTHPIQYYIPLFQELANKCNLKVFYTWGENGVKDKYDPEFKRIIEWDIPLLMGYDYELLNNTAKNKGSHHFMGIKNPALIKKVKDFNPNAVLIYGWAYQSHLSALRYFKGKIPMWFRGDSTLLNDSNNIFINSVRSLFLTWVYTHVDKVFYVGSQNKAYYSKFGLKFSQLIFAPHAVDNKRFAKNYSVESEKLRTSLGIKENDKVVLFAGKLQLIKNPTLLLKAFIELNLPTTHLLIVGNGEVENELKLIKDKSGFKNIHFLATQNQTQMPIIYQSCDLFCLPSKRETWGLAVNEAMAASKAILVSSQVGCAIDLIESEINGYIFQFGNLEDLKSKLSILLNSSTNLIQMGQASNKIIQNWSIKNQADTILMELNK